MKKNDSIFLKHMLDAINLIEEYLRDKDYDEFKNNHMLQDEVIREIEIIGEATKNLSMEFRNKHLNIPWRQIVGMRDKLIHGYFGVDIDAVWDTVMKGYTITKGKTPENHKRGEK